VRLQSHQKDVVCIKSGAIKIAHPGKGGMLILDVIESLICLKKGATKIIGSATSVAPKKDKML